VTCGGLDTNPASNYLNQPHNFDHASYLRIKVGMETYNIKNYYFDYVIFKIIIILLDTFLISNNEGNLPLTKHRTQQNVSY